MIGIFGGRFTPLHNGHVGAIIRASMQVARLYVILSWADEDVIPKYQREKWLNGILRQYENITIVPVKRKKLLETEQDWLEDAENIRKEVKKYGDGEITKVFMGSRDHADMFEKCYPDAEIVVIDPLRSDIHISGTEIRTNPFKYWEYLPKFVRKDYVKVVRVKNKILRNQLADRFNTTKVGDPFEKYVKIYGYIPLSSVPLALAEEVIALDEAKYNANKIIFAHIANAENLESSLYIDENTTLDDAIEQVKKLLNGEEVCV